MPKAKLVECQFLVPLRRDAEISDGKLVDTRDWRWLQEKLLEQFGGWGMMSDSFEGAWRSGVSGKESRDFSKRYFVALSKSEVQALREILKLACIRFGQQCIYLSVAGMVEFVEEDA
jgi:hypothetical protein